MLNYVFRRLGGAIPTLFIIIAGTFFMMRLAPGGPFARERVVPPEVEANLMKAYHLDEPLWQQFLRYLSGLAQGDFGPSFKYKDFSVADLIFGGVCHRFPDLEFVSVESGVGWLLGLLEAFDWQWQNSGIREEHPEYELLPSAYFERQIYGCFWFENEGARRAIERFPGNVLYETDFPHPTCMAPGPRTSAEHPRVYAQRVLGDLPDEALQKVLHDNAAALYGLA